MNNRLKSLDVLKGIGIIMIIIVHNRHFIMKDMEGCRGIINYGQMGCQIFFLVSGMALCCSWFCQLAQTPRQAFFKNYITFTARRYFRLAPGFLIMLALNFILNTIIIDIFHSVPGFVMNRTLPAIITNIFFIHGFFPEYINDVFPGGWYIGTAFILYLIFPFLVSLCRKLCQINLRLLYVLPLIFLIANILLLRYITKLSGGDLYPGNNSFLYYFFTNQLPCFTLGIILYFQENNRGTQSFSKRCPLAISVTLFIMTGLLSLRLFLLPEDGSYLYTVMPSLTGISFYWLAVSLIHMELKTPHNKVLSFFADITSKCGRVSYGMYLVHSLICWYGMKAITSALTAYGYDYNDLRLYILVLLPSILAVYIMGSYMEAFLNKLKR